MRGPGDGHIESPMTQKYRGKVRIFNLRGSHVSLYLTFAMEKLDLKKVCLTREIEIKPKVDQNNLKELMGQICCLLFP